MGRRFRTWIGFVAVMASFWWPCGAVAAGYISEQAWLEDPGGELSFKEVQQKNFTPYTALLTKGYSASTFWVRLRINPPTTSERGAVKAQDQLVIRIRPPYIDHIELYDPLEPNRPIRQTGDSHAWEEDEYQSLNLNFLVPLGEEPRHIWLRLRTTSSILVSIEAIEIEEARYSDTNQQLLFGVYLGALVLFFSWGMILWLQSPDKLVAIFVIQQFFSILFSISILGYSRIYLSDLADPNWVNLATSITVVSFTFTAVLFDYTLLKEFNPPVWCMRMILALAFLFPMELMLFMLGETRAALLANMAVMLALPTLALLAALLSKPDKASASNLYSISKPTLVLAFALIFAALLVTSLPSLGVVSGAISSLYTTLTHGIVYGIILTTILQLRAGKLLSQHHSAMTRLAISEEATKQAIAHRKDQEKLLSMLSHEIKTPLAVARMVLGSRTIKAESINTVRLSLDEINSIIQRCLETGKAEEQSLGKRKEPCNLKAELDGVIQKSKCSGRIQLSAPAELELTTDRELIRVILGNLIENACRYSAQDSSIKVIAGLNKGNKLQPHHADGLYLIFENEPGPSGWPDQQKIFDKYYRSPGARSFTGSGLGLYLVKLLVEHLEGKIEYQPDSSYVRFMLWLPS